MEIINGFVKVNSIVKILSKSYNSPSIVIYIDYINFLVLCLTNETTTSVENLQLDIVSPTDLLIRNVSEVDNKTVQNYINNLLIYTNILNDINNIYTKYSNGFTEDFKYIDEAKELKEERIKLKYTESKEQLKRSITGYYNDLKRKINNYFNPLKEYKLNIKQYEYNEYKNPDPAIFKNILEYSIIVGIYINSSDKAYSDKLLNISGYGLLIGNVNINFTNQVENPTDEKTIKFNPYVLLLSDYNKKYKTKLTLKDYKRNEINDQISKDFETQIPIWIEEAKQLCKEKFTQFRHLKIAQTL